MSTTGNKTTPQKKTTYQKSNTPKASTASTYRKNENAAAIQAKLKREKEIRLFIYMALSLFLLCSNFGWCGVVGDFIAGIIFGLFGTVTYILPVYFFVAIAYYIANGAQRKLIKRIVCAALFLLVIAFVCQFIAGLDGQTIKELYIDGYKDKRGGGVLFGGLIVLLSKFIGFIGAVIVTVLIGIVTVIVVLDVSLIDMFKNASDNRREKRTLMHEYESENDVPVMRKLQDDENRVSMVRIKQSDEKKNKKKTDNEDVHELKPIKDSDLFGYESNIQNNVQKDFFELKPTYDVEEDVIATTEMEPSKTKHKRKKTKESYQEMVESTNSIAQEIDKTSAANAYSNIEKQEKEIEKSDILEKKIVYQPVTKSDVNSTSDFSDTNRQIEYTFPPITLLKSLASSKKNNDAAVRDTAIKLKTTLESFGVNVTITDFSCGPSVTRYELQPEQGVKVNKIVGLADDIKLNLAAADIRIEAPIPGKAAIGIEVPNKESTPVSFRELLEADEFNNSKSNVSFAVGKDISGKVMVADIAKMPHLLIAGATGSGKSVCINTLIMSIIYKAKPSDVKLIMIDPKQVELSVYNGIPHLFIPVVTDPKKAAGALNWAVNEMTSRYELFAQYNVRNLEGYNKKVYEVTGSEDGNEELRKLPQMVIIVDELADLMMVAHGEVEDAIVRLSQLARAAGIHLVIATQRPSVDVITGLIKANVPSRIAMTVSSGVDSRTILDMNGAEKLLGKGDMLFYPTGYPKPVRVQGAFLSDQEISDVVGFIKDNNTEASYDSKAADTINSATTSLSGSGASSEYDDYFADAGKFIIGKDKASIGMLQRVYKVGFNRAARIMDQLSDAGVVGPEEGTKPRKILMTMEEFENYVEEHL